ncbi:MAG: carbohydrate ABC transporter substrate-binding protein [Pseudobutyrivibrio sp.]|nr:carbohydrate ABC transporter substrate-binding protein [Pseudobutyrivibrio sp.]
MKKKLLSLVLVSAMATSMVACGSGAATTENGSTGSAPAATEGEAGGHKLTLWAWDESFNIPAMQAAAEDYKEVDPEFELEIITQSQSSDVENAITNAGQSGDFSNLADITLFQDHYFQQFCVNYPDAWVSVDDAGVDWNGLGAEKLSYSTVDGVHYGFPVDAGTAIMAYNTEYLAAAGYTLDDVQNITWDEFIEIGKKVKEATGKYLLCMDGSGNDFFYMMCQAEGVSQWKDGQPYVTENQTLVDIFTVQAKMAQEGVLYLANDWGDYTDQAIVGDMVAGVYNGNWIIPTIKKVESNAGKWEIVPAPTLTGKPGYASNGGSSLYITSNCQNTELAKAFLAYTFGGGSAADGTSLTYDNALLNGGVIGTCAAAAKSDVYQAGVDYFNGQAIYADIVAYTQNVPVIEQNDYHYTLREKLSNHLISVVNGEEDIDAALAAAEQETVFAMQE